MRRGRATRRPHARIAGLPKVTAAFVEPMRAKLVSRLPEGLTGRGDGRRSPVGQADRHPTNGNYKTISGGAPSRPLRYGSDPAAANRPGPALGSSSRESVRARVRQEDRPRDERKLQNNFGTGAGEAAEVWRGPGGRAPTGPGGRDAGGGIRRGRVRAGAL